jgi:hypothetical protein
VSVRQRPLSDAQAVVVAGLGAAGLAAFHVASRQQGDDSDDSDDAREFVDVPVC